MTVDVLNMELREELIEEIETLKNNVHELHPETMIDKLTNLQDIIKEML